MFSDRHPNVSECLGRLVHGPFVANVDVCPAASVLVMIATVTSSYIYGFGSPILALGALQEASPPAGLSLPDKPHDLFHDRCLGSFGRILVFVVVLAQEFVVQDVAGVHADTLSPPAQDVPVGRNCRRRCGGGCGDRTVSGGRDQRKRNFVAGGRRCRYRHM